jgi:hypothetical protein
MPELTAVDVDLYTKGRLPASDPETSRLLNRALAAARRYCEWPVTPPATRTVTLDGPSGRVLMLPTLALVTLTSVVEEGISLNIVTDLDPPSAAGPVRLRKKSGARWSCKYSSIVVTMTDGYTEAKADDWRLAVLDAVDRFHSVVGLHGLKRYTVDDVERDWFENPDAFNERLMEPYRLLAPG